MSIQTPPGASQPEDSPGRYGRAERISVLSFNTHGDGVPLTGTGRLHSSSFLKPTGFSRRPLCLPSPLTLGRASEKSAMEAEALQEWPSPCRGLLSMSPLCDHVGVHVSFQNFPDVPLYFLWRTFSASDPALRPQSAFETEALTGRLAGGCMCAVAQGDLRGPWGRLRTRHSPPGRWTPSARASAAALPTGSLNPEDHPHACGSSCPFARDVENAGTVGHTQDPDGDALTAPSLPRPAAWVSDGDAEAGGPQGASERQAHRALRVALRRPAELHSPASATPRPWARGSERTVLPRSGPAWRGCRDRHQGTLCRRAVGRKAPRAGAPSRDNPAPLGFRHGLPASLSLLSKPYPPSGPLHRVSVYKRQMLGAHPSQGRRGRTDCPHAREARSIWLSLHHAVACAGGSHVFHLPALGRSSFTSASPAHVLGQCCHLWKTLF